MMMPRTINARTPAITRMNVVLSIFFSYVSDIRPPKLSSRLLKYSFAQQLFHDRQHSGSKNNHHEGWENEKHKRRYHLHARLRAHLLGPLTAARAHIVGVDAKRLGDAGTKSLCLDQHGNQRLDGLQASATG